MLNKVLETPVDKIIEELKTNKILSITQIQKKLKLPLTIIERWLVILEEYKVIKTTYKGFEGFVEFVEKKEKSNEPGIEDIKLVFIDKCKEKKLDFNKMKEIWPIFLEANISEIKKEFEKDAISKKYDVSKIKLAWLKFEKDLRRF